MVGAIWVVSTGAAIVWPCSRPGSTLGSGGAADLQLALRAVAAGDHAVRQDPRVAQQVSSLRRLPHHGQPQAAVEHVRLDGAKPGVPSRRMVATSTTPGPIRRCWASPARRGCACSISDQRMAPPDAQVGRCPSWPVSRFRQRPRPSAGRPHGAGTRRWPGVRAARRHLPRPAGHATSRLLAHRARAADNRSALRPPMRPHLSSDIRGSTPMAASWRSASWRLHVRYSCAPSRPDLRADTGRSGWHAHSHGQQAGRRRDQRD